MVSVDEALIDVTSEVQRRQGTGEDGKSNDILKDLADEIRSRVREATKCEGNGRTNAHSYELTLAFSKCGDWR